MAEVVPFKGVRYNPALIPDMAAVVAPPYDVISPKEQEGFYQSHPNNVIRLILGKHQAGDNAADNVHVRSGSDFHSWLAQNVLMRDSVAAFYLTAVDFTSYGQSYTRYGIIGRVRLEPFDKGIILPHERTFSKVKSERLLLMKACHANFSPIFGLFSGGTDLVKQMQEIAATQLPVMDLIDSKGHRQRMWCVTEKHVVSRLTAFFESERIYIADGHHRYETALNYREWVKESDPAFASDHPANFIMMSLSSMADPGMIILPAHRLLKSVPPRAKAEFQQKMQDYFEITTVATDKGVDEAVGLFTQTLESLANKHAIGLFSREPSVLQVMVLKEGIMARLFKDQIPPALQDLDVTILTHVIMMALMGFDQETLDDQTKIIYRTAIHEAFQSIEEGEADMAFILNPTKIEQVQRVAEHGLIMPRKSTYFYPKVISGLVFNLLR
ncbi:MAG: hypothetical protein VR64_16410 [Desulfatitalea sp. BRH_c12]|nr:MAG: hypothetical protein VR64_16410 [Desulfatitalea sp. BRH_c12]